MKSLCPKLIHRLLWMGCLLAWALPLRAEVTLPAIFGEHMVLQQDQPLTIWGWAARGEQVTVTLLKQSVQATANAQGEWKLSLNPLPAGGPHTLTIAGTNTVTFNDVLVGEVWLCSGQSNMEMWVGNAENGAEEIAAANYPQIRMFCVQKQVAAIPARDVKGQWVVCSPAALALDGPGGVQSATAYFFGRELHRQLKRPIGLINSSWGGTAIEPWTAPEGFAQVPALSAWLHRSLLLIPGTEVHRAGIAKLISETETWIAAAKQASSDAVPPPAMPAMASELAGARSQADPGGLYQGMIRPLVPYTLRGAIWYQGEGNHLDIDYHLKMQALIGGWREVWGLGDFPFYFVQIAPFDYGGEAPTMLPLFWEQQTSATLVPNTGMAVINDVGDVKDIHPRKKQAVGKRLALLALARTYGHKDVVCSGPVFKSLKVEAGALRVTFAETAGGLVSRDGKPLTHFEVIDRDKGGFVPAEATIDGASVVLRAAAAPNPVAMRFAWSKLAEPNLANGAGLPANSFRAGQAPNRERLLMEVPEAGKYTLIYDLDLTTLGADVRYAVDRRATAVNGFERVAYLLELGANESSSNYVWTSMDAFTQDAAKIGVPTFASGARFQQQVTNVHVASNMNGVATEERPAGWMEFWSSDYAPTNKEGVAGATDQSFDTGDTPAGPSAGYGSMQVHLPDANRTLFAINDWRQGEKADVGIGSNPNGNPDWTFSQNAAQYPYRRLRVYVKLKP